MAIATAAIVPLLSYMEARDRARTAEDRAEAATVQQEASASETRDTTRAVYQRTSEAAARLQQDITACHKRVDALAQAMVELATSRRSRRSGVPKAVVAQREISRPAPTRLPQRRAEVSADDPLADALE